MAKETRGNRGLSVAILVVGVAILIGVVALIGLTSAQMVQIAALNSLLSSWGAGPIIGIIIAIFAAIAAAWAWFEGLF